MCDLSGTTGKVKQKAKQIGEKTNLLRRHERTGRPLGSVKFLKGLEKRLGRVLRPQKRGRKSEKSKK